MQEILGAVTLCNKENMLVKVITPPAEEYVEKLAHFLEHKGDNCLRDIRQRLRGDYADICVDKYFIGEINGQIAGQLWYGYADTGINIANFGHVYTEPAHRKKGISDHLMEYFLEDFHSSPVAVAICGTGSPWVARIYMKHGFKYVQEGTGCINNGLILYGKGHNDFKRFDTCYFTPGQAVKVVPGTMRQRHAIDSLMMRSFALHGKKTVRFSMASRITSYRDAYFMSEDGRGLVSVALTDQQHVVGWTFFLNTGSLFEETSKIFDYEIHPAYADKTEQIIMDSLALARTNGITNAYALRSSADVDYLTLLQNCGFSEIARIDDYLLDGTKHQSLVILKHKNI
jgi:GNAT superfamily N-acetyltransferase